MYCIVCVVLSVDVVVVVETDGYTIVVFDVTNGVV